MTRSGVEGGRCTVLFRETNKASWTFAPGKLRLEPRAFSEGLTRSCSQGGEFSSKFGASFSDGQRRA